MSSGQFLGSRERPLVSSFIDCFFFVFLCTAYIVKGTFFRSIWNLFALVGFSETSTAFDLRASFWLDKKKSANKFQIELEFVLLPRNNL